jgi:type IV fimbrial biogenesis protein FimT
VTRGEKVILCRSANPTAASPSCGGNSYNWSSGWLVFVNNDANTTYDAGTDVLLRATDEAGGSVTIKTNDTSNTNLVYNADGTIDMGGQTAVFAICDDRGADHGNQIQVSPTGRPRLISPVPASCDSPSA